MLWERLADGCLQRGNTRTKDHVDYRKENTNTRVNDDRASFLSHREHTFKGEGKYNAPLHVLMIPLESS